MDKYYMGIALQLAKNGIGKVSPNPLVGALIVKENKIVGSGYHEIYGGTHAEINAINNTKVDIKGSTLYVTLEPCSHYGKTPPCVDRIIEKKIRRVVVGMIDPNPLVSGNGVKRLRELGVEVIIGVLEDECKKLNEVFIKYITHKKPFVVLKSAMSLDGKIATAFGESKWITCEESRIHAHNIRNQLTGIMVGIETVIKDNPLLTCRILGGRNPIRIIVDSKLRIPEDSNIVKTCREVRTMVATTEDIRLEKVKYLEDRGIVVLRTRAIKGRVNLEELMYKLYDLSIDSILLEGGATLNYSALELGIVDKILTYIAPKIIGGENSKGAIGGMGIKRLEDIFKINNMGIEHIGNDILITGYM